MPETLVGQEMERRLHDLAHRLEEQGIDRSRSTSPRPARTRRSSSTGSAAGPTEAVRADLALRAVVAQEEIEATDDELDAEIDRLAERMGEKPAEGAEDLERRGVLEAVRSDIARGKALRVPRSTTRPSSTTTATRSTSRSPTGMPTPNQTLHTDRPTKPPKHRTQSAEEPEA